MILKSILIAFLIIQLSVCHPISNDVTYCKFKSDSKHGKYIAIDCQGNPVYSQMCNNLQMDTNTETAISLITFENCEIDDIGGIIPNFEVNITQMVYVKNNTMPTADFSYADGLSLLVITNTRFKSTTPSSLQIEASELKWFEYDGKDRAVVDSITMTNPAKLEFFSMEKTSVSSLADDFFNKSTELKIVCVPSNKFESIDSLNWPYSLKWLDISSNDISQLSNKSFENLSQLQILSMKANGIHDIQPGTFSYLNNLIYLSMEENSIKEIKSGFFDGLSGMVAVDMDDNEIESIEAGVFEATPKLSVLSLSGNKIPHLNENTFSGMGHLKFIDMGWNPIDEMALQTFANVSQLKNLDLSHCKLRAVDFNTFANNWKLEELDLSHNKIEHLVKMSSSHLTKKSVSSNTVSSQSETGILNAFKWMDAMEDYAGKFMSENVKDYFNGVLSLSLAMDLNTFVDSFDWNSFDLSFEENETTEATWELEILTLSENQLTVIEKDVFAEFKNLEKLYLTKNPITTLYPESFAGLHALTYLYMDYCKLASVDFASFAHLSKLEILDLSHNQLATITAAPLPSLKNLLINDNHLASFPMQKNDFPHLKKFNVRNNNLECSTLNTFVDIKFYCGEHSFSPKRLRGH